MAFASPDRMPTTPTWAKSRVSELFGESVTFSGYANVTRGGVLITFFQANAVQLAKNYATFPHAMSATLPIQETGWDPVGFRNSAQRGLNFTSRGLDGVFADAWGGLFRKGYAEAESAIKKQVRRYLEKSKDNILQDGDYLDVDFGDSKGITVVKGPRMNIRGNRATHFDQRQVKQLFALYYNKLMSDHEKGREVSILFPIGGMNYGIPDMLNTFIRVLAINKFIERVDGKTSIKEIATADGGNDGAFSRVMTSLLSAHKMFGPVTADKTKRCFQLTKGPAFKATPASRLSICSAVSSPSVVYISSDKNLIQQQLVDALKLLEAQCSRERDALLNDKQRAANALCNQVIETWFPDVDKHGSLHAQVADMRPFDSTSIARTLDVDAYGNVSKYHQKIVTSLNVVNNLARALARPMPDATPSAPTAGAGAAAAGARPEDEQVVRDWATHENELNVNWRRRRSRNGADNEGTRGVIRCGRAAGELAKSGQGTERVAVILDDLSDGTIDSLGISPAVAAALRAAVSMPDVASNEIVKIQLPERNQVFLVLPRDYRSDDEVQVHRQLFNALRAADAENATRVVYQTAPNLAEWNPAADLTTSPKLTKSASLMQYRTHAVNAFIDQQAVESTLRQITQVMPGPQVNAMMVYDAAFSHYALPNCVGTEASNLSTQFGLTGPFDFNEEQMCATLGVTAEQMVAYADLLDGDLRKTREDEEHLHSAARRYRRDNYPRAEAKTEAVAPVGTAPTMHQPNGISALSHGNLADMPSTDMAADNTFALDRSATAVARAAGSHAGLTTMSMMRGTDSRSAVEGTMFPSGDAGPQHQQLLAAALGTLPDSKKASFTGAKQQGGVMLIPHGNATTTGTPMFYLAIIPYDKAHSAGNVDCPEDYIVELTREYKRALTAVYVQARKTGKIQCRLPLIAAGVNAPMAIYKALYGDVIARQQVVNDSYEAFLRAVEAMPSDFASLVQADPVEFNKKLVDGIGAFSGCEFKSTVRDASEIRPEGENLPISMDDVLAADDHLHIVKPQQLVQALAKNYSGHYKAQATVLQTVVNVEDARAQVEAARKAAGADGINPMGHMAVIDSVVRSWEALAECEARVEASRAHMPPAVAPATAVPSAQTLFTAVLKGPAAGAGAAPVSPR